MNNLLQALSPERYFFTEYNACHRDFLAKVKKLSALHPQCESFLQGETGTTKLLTEAIWLGPDDATKVLVIISGTHGVEGYCGSAIQRLLLDQLQQQQLPMGENSALLFLHALNPWGMYWARRCDQSGIDLNRNFIDFSARPDPDPDYSQLLTALSDVDVCKRNSRLLRLRNQWGQTRYDEVLSGGQYHQPWAPFYGGTQPANANQVIEQIIQRWSLASRELIVLDLHTGLGPFGHGELISDHPADSPSDFYSRSIYGDAIANTELGDSFSVPKAGLMDYRWHQLMSQKGCYLTLEFGTLGTQALFDVLFSESLYWRDQQPATLSDSEYSHHRQAMINHFCPADPLWRQTALFKGWQVVQRALDYFNEK